MEEKELRTILKPMFAQFATSDSDAEGKFLGYFIALAEFEGDVIREVVKRYICGQVAKHDKRFLPTSAEIADEARNERAERRAAKYEPSGYVVYSEDRRRIAPRPRWTAEERAAAIDALEDGGVKQAVLRLQKAMEAQQ